MRHLLPRILLAVLLAVPLCAEPAARPVSAQAETLRFEHLTVEQGLSQNSVQAILQDHMGFLWIGTEDGLNEYDGSQFRVYRHDPDEPTSLSSSAILSLFEDRENVLWVGTQNGLNRFDRRQGAFQQYSGMGVLGPVYALAEDPAGNLWVGTEDGVGRLSVDRSGIVFYHTDPQSEHSLAPGAVRELWVDPIGILWIGTEDGGLDRWSPLINGFDHLTQQNPTWLGASVRAVTRDTNGDLWIGTCGDGLYRYRAETQLLTLFAHRDTNPHTIPDNCVRSLVPDQSGGIWVGTDGGIALWDPAEEQITALYRQDPNDAASLGGDQVNAIYYDSGQALWVGVTGGGLSMYSPYSHKFDLLRHVPSDDSSLASNQIQAITAQRDDLLWVGTADHGVDVVRRSTGQVTHYRNIPANPRSLSSDKITQIVIDPLGLVWIATQDAGLNRFQDTTHTFVRFQHSQLNPNSLSGNQISALSVDRDGSLWIASLDGDLDRYDRSTAGFVHYPLSIASTTPPTHLAIRSIYQDYLGKLWLAADQGLYQFDPEKGSLYEIRFATGGEDGHINGKILSFYEEEEGQLWFGSTTGLYSYNPLTQATARFSQKDGLPNETINCILGDSNGNLWLSTNNGLSRFNEAKRQFRNYDLADGLQSPVFNPGVCAADPQGELFFGGNEGLNVVDPLQIQDNPHQPPIVVTSLKKFNQEVDTDLGLGAEEIRLSYQDNYISFEFAGLDFSAPQKNQYAYMLEGFDTGWVSAGTRRYASYTNLRGGDYVFRVKGANSDGVWNENGIAIHLHITPPVWETLWFRGLALVLVLLFIYGLYRLRINQIQVQTRELALQVEERTTELRQEIAQRVETEKALRKSESRYRDLVENANSIILRWDSSGKITFFNRYAQHFFGYTQDEILGQNLVGTLLAATDENGKPTRTWLEDILTCPDDYYSFENENVTRDGRKVWIAWTNKVIPETDGRISEVLSIGIDRTSQKHAEEALNRQTEQAAISAERSRLARDLHDAVSQTLFSTSLIADVLPRIWDRNPEEGRRRLDEIRQLTRGALAEMRTLLLELRPNALLDADLSELFRHLADAFTGRTHVPVTLHVATAEESGISLPAEVKISYYRVTQEALNNIAKHAGAAQVEISLGRREDHLVLEIRDDGHGFAPGAASPDHLGLQIMRERCESVGAELWIHSQTPGGTTIRVSWAPPEDLL